MCAHARPTPAHRQARPLGAGASQPTHLAPQAHERARDAARGRVHGPVGWPPRDELPVRVVDGKLRGGTQQQLVLCMCVCMCVCVLEEEGGWRALQDVHNKAQHSMAGVGSDGGARIRVHQRAVAARGPRGPRVLRMHAHLQRGNVVQLGLHWRQVCQLSLGGAAGHAARTAHTHTQHTQTRTAHTNTRHV
jgi:hypothetical protein